MRKSGTPAWSGINTSGRLSGNQSPEFFFESYLNSETRMRLALSIDHSLDLGTPAVINTRSMLSSQFCLNSLKVSVILLRFPNTLACFVNFSVLRIGWDGLRKNAKTTRNMYLEFLFVDGKDRYDKCTNAPNLSRFSMQKSFLSSDFLFRQHMQVAQFRIAFSVAWRIFVNQSLGTPTDRKMAFLVVNLPYHLSLPGFR